MYMCFVYIITHHNNDRGHSFGKNYTTSVSQGKIITTTTIYSVFLLCLFESDKKLHKIRHLKSYMKKIMKLI